MKSIIDIILDLLGYIFNVLKNWAQRLVDKFMEINFFEKGIVITVIPAFIGVVAPVGRYFIFATYFYINNPLAVHMIFIVGIMFVTMYFPGLISLGVRIVPNVIYLIYVIYLGAAREISKAPYDITMGYYLNIAVPLIFIVLSVLSYFTDPGN